MFLALMIIIMLYKMFLKKKRRKLEKIEEADPPVTARETKKCIDLLQKFFVQENNENNPSDKIETSASPFC